MSLDDAGRRAVEKAVTGSIEAAIAKALTEDPTALVEKVCEMALSIPDSSYTKESVFAKAVQEMIRTAAKETFAEWLEEHKEMIRTAVRARLDKQAGGFLDTVAERLTSGLAKSFYVSCHLTIADDKN